AVRHPDRTDQRLAGAGHTGPAPDPPPVTPLEDYETLLLMGVDVRSHDVGAGLDDQLGLEKLAVGGVRRGSEDQSLPGLGAVDDRSDRDHRTPNGARRGVTLERARESFGSESARRFIEPLGHPPRQAVKTARAIRS